MKFTKYFRGLMTLMFLADLHASVLAQVRHDPSSWGEDVKAAKYEDCVARNF